MKIPLIQAIYYVLAALSGCLIGSGALIWPFVLVVTIGVGAYGFYLDYTRPKGTRGAFGLK